MRRTFVFLAGVAAVVALGAWTLDAGAETCQLELKKVAETPTGIRAGGPSADYIFGRVYPQSTFIQFNAKGPRPTRRGEEGKPEFSKLITKEPAKYAAKFPFRGVVALGDQHFGFALDAAEPKADAKKDEAKKDEATQSDAPKDEKKSEGDKPAPKMEPAVPYARLYFDLNHNGDLTDDQVIEARTMRNYEVNYAQSMFPQIDVAIELDGKKVDYAFTLRVYLNTSVDYAYSNCSIQAAAYRDGEITLDGKKYRVVVVDFNSNGRFDDASGIDPTVQLSDGTVYPQRGDTLYLLDPDAPMGQINPYEPTNTEGAHFVGKLVNLNGRFFRLVVSPTGDTVSLEPSDDPVGFVTNPNKGYRATVYGDKGFLKVVSDADGKAPLPEGQWRLLDYTIDQTGMAKPKEEPKKEQANAAKPKASEPSLMKALIQALAGSGREVVRPPIVRYTRVSARAKRDGKPFTVVKDQTVALPFGPPYRPVVDVQYRSGADSVSLGLSLVGSADEVCTSLMVDGRQPPEPAFTISTEDGKEVAADKFSYG
ncbi:MAG: hypothetical protein JW809_04435 [Pirellulales bacterium]|nr:hypothetical protein [Pirellulales bacterium]